MKKLLLFSMITFSLAFAQKLNSSNTSNNTKLNKLLALLKKEILKKYPDFKSYKKPPYFSKSKIEAYCLFKTLNITDDIRAFALYSSPSYINKENESNNQITYVYRFKYLIENYGNSNWIKNEKKLLENFTKCVKELSILNLR